MKYTVVFVAVMLSAGMAAARPAGMNEECNAVYDDYAAAAAPKAFAHSKNGACGWQSDAKLADAKKRAIAYCVANDGTNCRVVESVKN